MFLVKVKVLYRPNNKYDFVYESVLHQLSLKSNPKKTLTNISNQRTWFPLVFISFPGSISFFSWYIATLQRFLQLPYSKGKAARGEPNLSLMSLTINIINPKFRYSLNCRRTLRLMRFFCTTIIDPVDKQLDHLTYLISYGNQHRAFCHCHTQIHWCGWAN